MEELNTSSHSEMNTLYETIQNVTISTYFWYLFEKLFQDKVVRGTNYQRLARINNTSPGLKL